MDENGNIHRMPDLELMRKDMFSVSITDDETISAIRNVYEKYGLYKDDYAIAADYELLVRFYAKFNVSHRYLHKVIVKMRSGGLSTKNFRSNIVLNREIVRSCRENGVKTNIFKVYSKYFVKLFQLFRRPD